jgi:hypothetical protein
VQNITLGAELAFLIDIDQRPETGSNWGWLPLPGTDFKDSFGPNHSFLQYFASLVVGTILGNVAMSTSTLRKAAMHSSDVA